MATVNRLDHADGVKPAGLGVQVPRSASEVKADIALTRQVIERDLDALHRHVPKRAWLSYSWLAGGVAAGLLLSQAPLLAVVTRALRMVQLGAGVLGMLGMVERVLAEVQSGRGDQTFVWGDRESLHRNGKYTERSER